MINKTSDKRRAQHTTIEEQIQQFLADGGTITEHDHTSNKSYQEKMRRWTDKDKARRSFSIRRGER